MTLQRRKPLVRKKAMQHGAALVRKTPMAQAKVEMKRTVQLRTSGPLPPQSAKRRLQSVERRSFVVAFLTAHPRCMVHWDGGCTGWSVHVHEALTRGRGGVIVPTEGRDQLFLGTCWWCHAQLHDHPAEAKARGFLRSA